MVSNKEKEYLPPKRNELWYSQKISELRKHLGLSQAAFAKKLGVSGAAIGQLERGESKSPSADLLGALTSMLSVNLDWLLNNEGPMLKSDQNSAGSQNNLSYEPGGLASTTSDPEATYRPEPRHYVVDDGVNSSALLYNIKTAASYLTGYQSQEQPEPDGVITLPRWLLKSGEHAVFPVLGESMEPTFFGGDYVLCRFLRPEEWASLRPETVCVVVSENRGLQLKRIKLRPSEKLIRCKSDNRQHPAFNLPYDEVLELWRFEWRLTANAANLSETVFGKVDALEDDVADLRSLVEQLIDKKELQRLDSQKGRKPSVE